MAAVEIKVMTGRDVREHINDLAALRIAVFREYPYLYDGTLEYEQQYFERYLSCARCVFVLACAGGKIVGASTGLPLSDEVQAFRQPFEGANIPVANVFYFGESVLLPTWRGKGVGHRFFDEREAYAKQLGPYPITAFCAVERPEYHPLRPADYRPHDAFWHKRGYTKRPELRTEFDWLDVNETAETAKPMVFWTHRWA